MNRRATRLRSRASSQGFTLVEIMVATTILAVMLVAVFSVIGQVSDLWRKSANKLEVFQGARLAFDLLTRNLSQATLNTSLDYVDSSNHFLGDLTSDSDRKTFKPDRYVRKSNLQFVCGPSGASSMPGTPGTGLGAFFQAPAAYIEDLTNYGGLNDALNICGYYVQFGPDNSRPAHILTPKSYRYQLMQLVVPIEKNQIFARQGETDFTWFTDYISSDDSKNYSRQVASNVIALIIRPVDPGDSTTFASSYAVNSRLGATSIKPQPITANQLPPVMMVTLVAIDETSMIRLGNSATPPAVITNALNGKFQNPALYDQDLADLQKGLTDARINFRVFSNTVPIRESKWSKN